MQLRGRTVIVDPIANLERYYEPDVAAKRELHTEMDRALHAAARRSPVWGTARLRAGCHPGGRSQATAAITGVCDLAVRGLPRLDKSDDCQSRQAKAGDPPGGYRRRGILASSASSVPSAGLPVFSSYGLT